MRPARARSGGRLGGAPARRAIIEAAPPTGPTTAKDRAKMGLPTFGRAEVQLIKAYALTALIVMFFTFVVPFIMSAVRNY